ncbi:MAG: DoxX family protein [Verrucomicrobiota bacterium]
MKRFLNLLQLNFIPKSSDFGLLALRVWLGASLMFLHGLGKLQDFKKLSTKFPDPLGVGTTVSYWLAIFGEVVCPVLLILGVFARIGALGSAVTMGVAFFLVHNRKLTGEGNGELAFIYLAGFVVLFLAGPGRFALDAKLSSGGGAAKSSPPKKN